MLHERIYIDKSDDRVYIDTYVVNDKSYKRDAILVIPGGGYRSVCTEREGEPVALAYVAHGMNAFVLTYRSGRDDDVYPKQLIDAGRAIIYIKENAEKFGIDPERVFTAGFSAGGHLSGACAIMYSDPEVKAALGISGDENKPRAAILGYPVVTANTPITHQASFKYLLRKAFADMTEEERRRYSLETAVNENSCPMFIWHTAEDTVVPFNGSLLLAQAAKDAGVNVTLHVYPYGPHSIALATKITAADLNDRIQPLAEKWLSDSVDWINSLR